MFNYSIGTYLMFAGIFSFFLIYLYKGKRPYIFLLIGIAAFGSRMLMDTVTVIKGDQQIQKFLTFKSSIEFEFSDGRKATISVKGNTIVNDSEFELKVEEVKYSTYTMFSSDDNIVAKINPYSVSEFNNIDYFFSEPPRSIRVKGGGSTTKYWLHK